MQESRQNRHRSTAVRRSDSRVAGWYEQSLDGAGHIDLAHSLATLVGALAGLEVGGMVNRPGRVPFSQLRTLAGSDRLSDFDSATVRLADLLSHVQLSADADALVWHAIDHGPVIRPVDLFLGDHEACVVLGEHSSEPGDRPGPAHAWSEPVTLHSSCTPGGVPVRVTRQTATTLAAIERTGR